MSFLKSPFSPRPLHLHQLRFVLMLIARPLTDDSDTKRQCLDVLKVLSPFHLHATMQNENIEIYCHLLPLLNEQSLLALETKSVQYFKDYNVVFRLLPLT